MRGFKIPTENEIKFVLYKDCEEQIAKLAEEKWLINQGYLMSVKGTSLRLRKQFSQKKQNYSMTFKSSVPSGRVVEIEKKIDERDFNDLWTQCLNKVEKIRHILLDNNREIWEVDFFKDHNQQTYFAMAEFEMPEGLLRPNKIPSFISNNLLYEVALTDSRYASKFLGDVRYALQLYESLVKESDGERRSKVSRVSAKSPRL